MAMKRITVLVLALLLIVSKGASALAQSLPQAAVVDLPSLFEKYASYQVDENGQWSARNIAASQLLKSAEAGSVKSSMSGGSCLLIPSIRGDTQRSYAEIVLHIYLFRTAAVKATGVSIVVGDVRYDFVANVTAEKVGAYSCERFDIPLNADGVSMLRGIAGNGCAIYIYGSDKPYQATIESADSLTAIRALLDELPEQYLSVYSLWTENAARWSAGRPGMSVQTLSGDESGSDLITPFDLLNTDNKDAVMHMQQLLSDAGFYVGNADIRWMPMDKWDALGEEIDWEELEGRDCYCGLDLSSTGDLTALVLVFPPKGDDTKYTILPFFWLPEDVIDLRTRRDHVPYAVWKKMGVFNTTEGNVVDYDYIVAFIAKLSERFRIREIAYDRYGAEKIRRDLEELGAEYGFTVFPFGQGFVSMSPPSKDFYQFVMEGRIRHGKHPVLDWNMGNVIVDQDAAGNINLIRRNPLRKSTAWWP